MRRTALACLLAVALAPQPAFAAGLAGQPHRAVYDLRLKRASDANVVEVGGRLVMEWATDCEGHVLNQRIVTRLVDSEGEEVLNDYQVTSWESRDGVAFRFNSRNEINGQLVEEVSGAAELERPGGPGVARFTKPEGAVLELPAGVLFPTAHTLAVIRAAKAGKRMIELPLFDGSGPDALFTTFSVIGEPETETDEAGRFPALAGIVSWPVHLGYFPIPPKPELAAGVPEFETGMRLFENGVTGDIMLDYGGFKLDGALSRYEPLPRPSC